VSKSFRLSTAPESFRLVSWAANQTFQEHLVKVGGLSRSDFKANFDALVSGNGSLSPLPETDRPLQFLHELLGHLLELRESFETLLDASRLHRTSLRLPKGLDMHRIRKLMHEAYLEELYLFLNRIENCVTFLQRSYNRDSELTKVADLGAELKKLVKAKFSELVALRGAHTHRVRLSHIFEEHRRIAFLDMLADLTNDSTVLAALKTARRDYHKETRQQLHETTLAVKDVLRGMSDLLMLYIEPNHRFKIPRRYSA